MEFPSVEEQVRAHFRSTPWWQIILLSPFYLIGAVLGYIDVSLSESWYKPNK